MTFVKNTNLIPTVCEIQIVDITDVDSITEGSTVKHRVVNFKPSKDWCDIYHTPGTMTYAEPSDSASAGTFYKQKAEGFYPGEDDDNLEDFDNIENKRFVVKLTYNNGNTKIFGDLQNPVKITKSFSSKDGGSTMTYYREGTDKAFLL